VSLQELQRYLEAHADLVALASLFSVGMLLGSMVLVPWLVIRAPQDVFVRTAPPPRGLLALGVMIARNVFAAVLLVAGFLMLLLPGQGLLTMVAGLCISDLPHKRALMRYLVGRPRVWRSLTWLRARAGQPPFEAP
jgi:hypothetical protein